MEWLRQKNSWIPKIIFVNGVVFLLWQWARFGGGDLSWMAKHFLVSWKGLFEGRVWTLWTAVFSHHALLHFFLNMYVLKGFGPVLEMIMGPRRFIRFYLLAGAFSSLCHGVLSAKLLDAPEIPALGASGAISGLLMLFALFFPRERIYLFGFIAVPAVVGVLIMVGLDLWGLFAQFQGGGFPIGHGAHLGGALFCLLYYYLVWRPFSLSKK